MPFILLSPIDMKTTDGLMAFGAMLNKLDLRDLFIKWNPQVSRNVLHESSLLDTEGLLHAITIRGGFVVLPDSVDMDRVWASMEGIHRGIPEALMNHYRYVWQVLGDFMNAGLNASQFDRVELLFVCDVGRSLLRFFALDKPIGLVKDGAFNPWEDEYVLYKLRITGMVGEETEEWGDANVEKEVLFELLGIPHFLIPATLSALGAWVAAARELF